MTITGTYDITVITEIGPPWPVGPWGLFLSKTQYHILSTYTFFNFSHYSREICVWWPHHISRPSGKKWGQLGLISLKWSWETKKKSAKPGFGRVLMNRPILTLLVCKFISLLSFNVWRLCIKHDMQSRSFGLLQSGINSNRQWQIVSFHVVHWVQAQLLVSWYLRHLTLRSQVVFNNRLLGLRSLWSTLAEWMYLRPLSIWYRK